MKYRLSIHSDREHCLFLMLALMLLVFVLPIIEGIPLPWIGQRGHAGESGNQIRVIGPLALAVFHTLILVSSAVAVSNSRVLTRRFMFGLGAAQLLCSWGIMLTKAIEFDSAAVETVRQFYLWTTIVLYLLVMFNVLGYVLRGKTVTRDRIFGAICVYIFLGIIWAFGYTILHAWNPESTFTFPGTDVNNEAYWLGDFIYFSFVTITSLGYGDITPVSRPAQMLAVSEALTGTLFMVLLMARLVGLYNPFQEDNPSKVESRHEQT